MNTFTVTNIDGSTTEWVQIDNPDGSHISMSKEYYDAQQTAQVAPQA